MNKLILSALLLLSIIGVVTMVVVRNYHHHTGVTGSINDQLVAFLQEYIRIDTTHPTPRYDQAINFLTARARADGFNYQEVALPSGKSVLIITYPGSDSTLPALALNHHMDVVPATDTDWIKPPFAGEIYDDQIIGRGTQDMKGIGAIHYFALKELKQQGITPRRTIHLFAVPDEEIGGFTGTKEFVQTAQFKDLSIGFIIDEGHASGDGKFLDIKIAERKPLQVLLTSKGSLAHGSRLQCHNAVHDLVQFLHQIVLVHQGEQKKVERFQPGELLSLNITSLTAGIRKANGHIAMNMVPDNAQATIDIRVPPCIKRANVLRQFEQMLEPFPCITYSIVAQALEEPEIGNYCTPLYKALNATAEKFNLKVRPHFFEASSDLRFYQVLGIDGVGFSPFTMPDNIHGTNESLPIDQLIRGKEIMVQFLKDFCS